MQGFCLIPSIQLMFLYYTTAGSWSHWLIILQIAIVVISFVLDLSIIVGMDKYTETYYLYVKKGFFVAYTWSVLFTLFATAGV